MKKEDILEYLKKNKSILQAKFQVKKIGLFGSFAKEKAHSKSDIDIIVDMPSNFDLYYDLKYYLEEAFKKEVDLGLEKNIRAYIKDKIKNEIIYV
jgi:predicted nucleotidyltransferase